MASNVLTATIKVNTQGVKQSFQETGTAAKKAAVEIKGIGGFATGAIAETKQVVKSLTAEISGLDAKLLSSKGGKALASELALAKAELKALEKQANITGASTGNIFTKAFGQLRQLAFILPGIGIAGIFNLAFEGVEKLVDSLLSANKALETNATILHETSDEYTKAAESVEVLRINIGLAKEGLISKTGVVKQYNESIGKTTGVVKSLEEAEEGLIRNGQAYVQMMLLKAAANVALEKAAKQAFETEETRRKKEIEFNTIGSRASVISSTGPTAPGFVPGLANVDDGIRARAAAAAKEKQALIKDSETRTKNLTEIAEDFQKQAAEISKKFGFNFFDDNSSKVKKIKEGFSFIKSALVDGLNDLVHTLDLNPSQLSVPFQLALDEAKLTVQFSALNEQLRGKLQQFATKISVVPISIKQAIEIDPNIIIPAGIRKETEEKLRSIFPTGTPLEFEDIVVDGKVVVNAKVDIKEVTRQLNQQIADTVKDLQVNIATSVGEAIGNAISGVGTAKDAFKAVFDFLGEGIKAIGVALIKIGALSEGIQKALASLSIQPELAITLGIAFVALSQVLKNSFNPREKGGPVTKGQTYQVNERGQEIFQPTAGKPFLITGGRQLFSPPTSGKIIPHKETEKILKTASVSKVKESFHKSLVKISGYRATGGNVTHGNNYVVNENGKEIFQTVSGKAMVIQGGKQVFTPPTSGKIISHSETKKILNHFSSLKSNTSRVVNNISSSIRNISGHRAGGGSVVGGNSYIVNERGAEIFLPNTGQSIKVHTARGSVSSGTMRVEVFGQFVQSGKDMIATIANAGRSQGRLA